MKAHAERLSQRFPQLFWTLGRDDLVEVFDLASSRIVISETSDSMLMEVHLPRHSDLKAGSISRVQSAREQWSPTSASGCGGAAASVPVEHEEEADEESPASPFTRGLRLKNALVCRSSVGAETAARGVPPMPHAVYGSHGTRYCEGRRPRRAQGGCASPSKLRRRRGRVAGPCGEAETILSSTDIQEHGEFPVEAALPANQNEGSIRQARRASCPAALPQAEAGACFEKQAGQAQADPASPTTVAARNLSSASLARLSEKRRRSGEFHIVDPGKPVLSTPGSHCPWSSEQHYSNMFGFPPISSTAALKGMLVSGESSQLPWDHDDCLQGSTCSRSSAPITPSHVTSAISGGSGTEALTPLGCGTASRSEAEILSGAENAAQGC